LELGQHTIEPLLVLCKKGNRLAQLEVYNRYQKAMYNVAYRIVKDTAEAEDVMQESFIAAFSKLDSFKGDATFGAWLKRIVVNNSISIYKKSQRYVAIDETLLEESPEEISGVDLSECSDLRTSAVLSRMDELQESYRQILTLHYIEGFDYEEICEILQISYGNCRTMISRAKESLRKKLAIAS
jgi:RNA polymerase sigma factor (sigma-70 family)